MATIVSFTVTPTTIDAALPYDGVATAAEVIGEAALLEWVVTGATQLIITQSPGKPYTGYTPIGPRPYDATYQTAIIVKPSQTTVYTLTATGGGTDTATVTLTVNPAPGPPSPGPLSINSFVANPAGVDSANNNLLLRWNVTGGFIYSFSPVSAFAAPSVPVPTGVSANLVATAGAFFPDTYYYSVTAFNTFGQSSDPSAFTGAVTISSYSNHVDVTWGATATATHWQVSRRQGLLGPTVYFPVVTTTSFTDRGTGILFQTSTGTFIDSLSAALTTGGTFVAPTATITYTLIATDPSGSQLTSSQTVIVSDVLAPVINSFTATPTSIAGGDPVSLDWNVSYADTITIRPGAGSEPYYIQAARVSPQITTTYTITATNSVGTTTATVTVTVSGGIAGTVIESSHPVARTVYTFQLPSWPGGTNTAYILFSLDTFVDPFGTIMTVSTDLDSQTFTGAQLSGYTLAIASSDGVLSITGDDTGYYGFRALSVSYTAPGPSDYLIGNPNPLDYPAVDWDGDQGPGCLFSDITQTPIKILPGQLTKEYSYQFRLPNGTSPTFSLSGSLPAGLSMDSAGLVSGTPTGPSSTFTVTATNGSPSINVSKQYRIEIYAVLPEVGTTTGNTPSNWPIPSHVDYTAGEWQLFNDTEYAFHRFGKRFCFLSAKKAYSNAIGSQWPVAFKSTDEGYSWTEMDAAGAPQAPAGYQNAISVAVTSVTGDGTNAIYTFNYGGGTPNHLLYVGDWVDIGGDFTQVGFTGIYSITAVTLTTFTIANTTVGTQTGAGGFPEIGNAIEIGLSGFPIRELSPTYPSNPETISGFLGNIGEARSYMYNDGESSKVYFVLILIGNTGCTSPGAGGVIDAVDISQTDYFLWEFDLMSETWIALTPTGYDCFYSFGTSQQDVIICVPLSTGDIRLFFNGNPHNDGVITNTQSGVWMVDYTPGTGWGTPVQIFSRPPIMLENGGGNYGGGDRLISIKHQKYSFLDNSVLDVTHVVFNENALITNTPGSQQAAFYNFFYHQFDSSGAIFTFQHDRIVYEYGGSTFLPGYNQFAVGTLSHDDFNIGLNGAQAPAVFRVDLTTPPTFSLEYVQQWNSRINQFDRTLWAGPAQAQYMTALMNASGNLVYITDGFNYMDETPGTALFAFVNTAPSGSPTDKSWSDIQELYSLVWAPFPGDVGFYSVNSNYHVEAKPTGGYYVHIDTYDYDSGSAAGEANFALVLARGAGLKNYTSGKAGAVGGIDNGVLGNYAFGFFLLISCLLNKDYYSSLQIRI